MNRVTIYLIGQDGGREVLGSFNFDAAELERMKADFLAFFANTQPGAGVYTHLGDGEEPGPVMLRFDKVLAIA